MSRPEEASVWVVWSARLDLMETWLREAAERWAGERVALFGDEVDPGSLLGMLCTPSLTGGPRMVVVRRAEKLGKEATRRLLAGLTRYPMASTDQLILVDSSPDGALASLVEAEGRDGGPTVRVVRLGGLPLAPGAAAPAAAQVEAELHRRALSLTREARRLVQAVLGRFPERAAVELDKLQSYPEQPLDAPAVRRLLAADLLEQADPDDPLAAGAAGSGEDRRRFQAVEAALSGDLPQAMRLMGSLLREGLPAAWLLREMARQAMQLWALAEGMEQRYGPSAFWPGRVPEDLAPPRLPGPVVQRQLAIARRLGTAGLLQVLEWVASADHQARRGASAEEALQTLVLRLATVAAPSPVRPAQPGRPAGAPSGVRTGAPTRPAGAAGKPPGRPSALPGQPPAGGGRPSAGIGGPSEGVGGG